MPIVEIATLEDAKDRLRRFFLPPKLITARQKFFQEHIDEYADFVYFLSTREFEVDVADASEAIWIEYNDRNLISSSNRYTRAIAALGAKCGLSGSASYVLTDEAYKLFGELLKGKHLWKDSFAPGHGEFAHSYQWLAYAISRRRHIGELYSGTQFLSYSPLFVKGNPAVELRRVFLWEWLVDCTRYNEKFDQQADAAATNYVETQRVKEEADQWYQIEGWVGVNELRQRYSTSTVFSSKYRNANTVTSLIQSRSGWFISAYENRSTWRSRHREDLYKIDFAVNQLGLRPPTDQERQEWAELDMRQVAQRLGASGKQAKQLQPIDLGKWSLKQHYGQKGKVGQGKVHVEDTKAVGFERPSDPRLAGKQQIRTAFHGIPGVVNAGIA